MDPRRLAIGFAAVVGVGALVAWLAVGIAPSLGRDEGRVGDPEEGCGIPVRFSTTGEPGSYRYTVSAAPEEAPPIEGLRYVFRALADNDAVPPSGTLADARGDAVEFQDAGRIGRLDLGDALLHRSGKPFGLEIRDARDHLVGSSADCL